MGYNPFGSNEHEISWIELNWIVDTVKKNAESLVAATKEIGLEVNAHKTKYMTVSRDQNAGWIHSMKIHNSSIERVEGFK